MSPLGSVSLTADYCLFQHQITSNFYATVSYNLNASINKSNKARLRSLNPKQSEISLEMSKYGDENMEMSFTIIHVKC